MDLLKKKILDEGKAIGSEILKVDNFLNHQIDVAFMEEIGKEFRKRFSDCSPNKILTVESSGIAMACETAKQFSGIPVLFAKKQPRIHLLKVITVLLRNPLLRGLSPH